MSQGNAAELTLGGGEASVAQDVRATRREPRALAGVMSKAALGATAVLLLMQWHSRKEGYLSAETGLGYVLGIAGASTMLLMLLYSVRKRLRFMRNLGRVQGWFHLHMLLGILGPAMIVAHSNFKLGSTNSRVAFFSMLLVAGSGLIGRFIYVRIHHGLWGRRLTVERLGKEVDAARLRVESVIAPLPGLNKGLDALEARLRATPSGFLGAIVRAVSMAVRTRWLRLSAAASIAGASAATARAAGTSRKERRASRRDARARLAAYLAAVRKEAELTAYERLFALWHVLHIPLFFLLVLATAVHVVVVHMY